ncbi:MAG: hypothetical protein QMD46_08730 [Methanomicrobiales archaeon]|nr:hypothetical protein [Methanomicrobiales archaeon]MDI6875451.1 hypothetical protein [Methanomicrobiales archaeon]
MTIIVALKMLASGCTMMPFGGRARSPIADLVPRRAAGRIRGFGSDDLHEDDRAGDEQQRSGILQRAGIPCSGYRSPR